MNSKGQMMAGITLATANVGGHETEALLYIYLEWG
jgi:hypothetical protein